MLKKIKNKKINDMCRSKGHREQLKESPVGRTGTI